MKKLTLLLFCLLSYLPAVASAEYTLIWADEFDYTGLPNPEYWSYDVGGDGWGNGEFQYYTDARPENARVENGRLIIEARKEDYEGRLYTSARILTENKKHFSYGMLEARIKLPAGVGVWPAFWMLGADFSTVGWPDCGEIDIMEFVGKDPNKIHGTIHGPFYSAGGGITGSHDFGSPATEDFHVFKIVWEENLIRWYVDDILYHSAGPDDIGGSPRSGPYEWVFDHPFFIILNVAIGGSWGGPVSPEMEFPVQMEVDYVRVYSDLGFLSGYPVNGDWVDTGDYLGWVNIAHYPWLFFDLSGSYAYLPALEAVDNWMYMPK